MSQVEISEPRRESISRGFFLSWSVRAPTRSVHDDVCGLRSAHPGVRALRPAGLRPTRHCRCSIRAARASVCGPSGEALIQWLVDEFGLVLRQRAFFDVLTRPARNPDRLDRTFAAA